MTLNMDPKFNKHAFSLLEMTVVIIIFTILATAIVPQLVKGYTINAANKTALDISAIEEASRAYYITNNKWPDNSVYPTPIAALQAGNYLPSNWNGINPFGYASATPSDYSYNVSSNGALLTINTTVPSAALLIIQNLLPVSSVSGNIVYSSVPVPGASSVMPTGTILAWARISAPAGFLICDGSVYNNSSYPNLAAVLGSTFGGDGITTFAVPDLKGRAIVGLNTIAVNDGSIRIWPTDTYSNNKGQAAAYYVNEIGGIFGEEKHRQALIEMAPHSHTKDTWIGGLNGGGGPVWGHDSSNGYGGKQSTDPAGGNGDGSSLGAPANVVPPSVALNYIIKT